MILINSVKNLLAFGLKSQDTQLEAVTDFWTTLNKKQKSQIELSIGYPSNIVQLRQQRIYIR